MFALPVYTPRALLAGGVKGVANVNPLTPDARGRPLPV